MKEKQRAFPFMHKPGYYRKAIPWLDRDYQDYEEHEQYNDSLNLYHVTTNLSQIVSSEGLKSRSELGYSSVGLGGGPGDEAADKVSTTYNYDRALKIYEELIKMTNIASGRLKASDVMKQFDTEILDDYQFSELLNKLNLSEEDKNLVENGNYLIIDRYIRTPEQVYNFYQIIEDAISEDELAQDAIVLSTVGMTADFEHISKINPNEIAILQLVARKNATAVEHIPLEQELRFKSSDLKVIRYIKP